MHLQLCDYPFVLSNCLLELRDALVEKFRLVATNIGVYAMLLTL
jgi:ABC-type enterobactin transport system permease subunit